MTNIWIRHSPASGIVTSATYRPSRRPFGTRGTSITCRLSRLSSRKMTGSMSRSNGTSSPGTSWEGMLTTAASRAASPTVALAGSNSTTVVHFARIGPGTAKFGQHWIRSSTCI